MRVRNRCNGAERVVELVPPLDGFTVADLAAALGVELHAAADGDAATGLRIDGCWHRPDTPLASLQIWEGALLEAAPAIGQAPSQPTESTVARPKRGGTMAMTGGTRAGLSLVSPRSGAWIIGRAPNCDLVIDDPAISRRHARVVFTGDGQSPIIGDLGSRNGTVVAGRAIDEPTPVPEGSTIRIGATSLQWRTPPDDSPAAVRAGIGAKAGRIPFNRPPRRRPRITSAPLRVPAAAPSSPAAEPLSWAGIALPVVAGLVLAVVWSPFMAVFAALGPMVTIGTWLERRRRARRTHQEACRDTAEKVERFVAALPAARAAERRRMIVLVPDPAELVRRASAPSVRCWERRRGDPDVMRLGVGTADLAFAPPLEVDGEGDAAAEALAAIQASGPLHDVPVAVSAGSGHVVGVVGAPSVARAVARSLVLQAAVLHGPADLAIAVLSAHPEADADWSWTRWLPHTTDVVGGVPGALVATTGQEHGRRGRGAGSGRVHEDAAGGDRRRRRAQRAGARPPEPC